MDSIVSLRKFRQVMGLDLEDIRTVAESAPAYYKPFDIYKGKHKDGSDKWRHIDNPKGDLKTLQAIVQSNILKPIALELPGYMTGGLPGRSILDNSSPHLGQPAVVGLDIADCFPSITNKMVFKALREDLGFSTDVASLITKATTFQNRLPQGAPTSPILCNLALRSSAEQINTLAGRHNCRFTIYIDDVTISGTRADATALIEPIIRLFTARNLKINKDKISIMDSNETQVVTGIKVNASTKVTKQKLEKIRNYILELGGKRYAVTKHELNAMWGMINFVKSVDKKSGLRFEQLARESCVDIASSDGIKKTDIRRQCSKFNRKH